jgi:hypothetical protein
MKRLPYHIRRGACRERFWWLEWLVRIVFVICVLGWTWKGIKALL